MLGLLAQHDSFMLSPAEHEVGKSVLLEVGEHALLDEAPARLDTEQEQEQEQEQEKEVKSRKDQQIEIEKFVDREYSRMEEAPRSWHISMVISISIFSCGFISCSSLTFSSSLETSP